MKKFIAMLMALSLGLFALGCQSSSTTSSDSSSSTTEKVAENKDPYKVGVVLSATGPAAPLGEPEKKTFEMLAEKINADGGIDGHDLELIIKDDQSEAKNANLAASELIDKDGVLAVIGGTTSASTMAMKTKTNQSKVPHVSMAAGTQITDPADTTPNEWIFRTAQSDAVAVQKVIDYLSKTLKIKKFAILHDSNAFGASGDKELAKLAPKAGLTITTSEAYNTNDTDMSSQLTKISGTKPDVIVVWGTNPGPAIAAKNMKSLNIKIPYVGSHGIANGTFIKLAEAAAEGVVFPAGKVLVPESATGGQAETITEFSKMYEEKYKEKPNSFAGHAYDAFYIVVNALKNSGADKTKLRDEIEKTADFNGVSGVFTYGKDNHDGTSTKDMIMVEIKAGKWILKTN
jgi:branched-chain amino acid transport system substrate-binding protein